MAHDLYVENGVFACASTQAEWHAKETGHAIVSQGDIDAMKQGACMDRLGRFVEIAPLHALKIDGDMRYITRKALIESLAGGDVIVHALRSDGDYDVLQPSGVIEIGEDIADILRNEHGIDARLVSAIRMGNNGTECSVSLSLGDLSFGAGDAGSNHLNLGIALTGAVDIAASTHRDICRNTYRMSRDQADKTGRRIIAEVQNSHGGITDQKIESLKQATKLAVNGVIEWGKTEAERLQRLKMIPFDLSKDSNLEKVLAHGIRHGIFGNRDKSNPSALLVGGPVRRGRKAQNAVEPKTMLTDDVLAMLADGDSPLKIYNGELGKDCLAWYAAVNETQAEETRHGIADMVDTLAMLDQAGSRASTYLGSALMPHEKLSGWSRRLVTDMEAALTPRVTVTV